MRLLLVFGIAIGLGACASRQHPLPGPAGAQLKGRQLVTTVRHPPPLATVRGAALTPFAPAAVLFLGPIVTLSGAGGVHQAAARIVRENGITDPAPAIARELGGYLRREYGVELAAQPVSVTVLTGEEATQLAAAYPSADVILDVETIAWGVERFSVASGACGVKYIARLRLIDARTVQASDGKRGSVVADGRCVRIPQEDPEAPACKGLLADGARYLKSELDRLARSCLDELRGQVLARPAR